MVIATLCGALMHAQSRPEEQYLATARSDYEILRSKLTSERQRAWLDEDVRRTDARSEWLKQWEATDAYIKSQSNGAELLGVRSFTFLKEFGERQLRDATHLVEGVGQELLNDRLAPISTEFERLRNRLEALRDGTAPGQLTAVVTEAFRTEGDAIALKRNPPVKLRFAFAPKDDANDQSRKLLGEFVLHDWSKALDDADRIVARLQKLDQQISVQEFLTPRDPNAAISLALQLAFLLVRCRLPD